MISKNTMAMPPMISQRRFDRRRPPSAPGVDAGLDPAVIGGAASGAAGAGGIDAGAEAGSMRGSPLSATLPSLALPTVPALTIRRNAFLSIAPSGTKLARLWTAG